MMRPRMTGFKCSKCGNSSLVRSNFRSSSSNKFFCRSDKRPACESERQYEDSLTKHKMQPETASYSPMEW